MSVGDGGGWDEPFTRGPRRGSGHRVGEPHDRRDRHRMKSSRDGWRSFAVTAMVAWSDASLSFSRTIASA